MCVHNCVGVKVSVCVRARMNLCVCVPDMLLVHTSACVCRLAFGFVGFKCSFIVQNSLPQTLFYSCFHFHTEISKEVEMCVEMSL